MFKKKCFLVSIAAFAIVSTTLFTSCTAKKEKTKEEVTEITSVDGRLMQGNLYLEGLPLVKEPESFTFLIGDSVDPDRIPDLEMLKLIEEKTNVTVEWDIYPHDVALERKNLLINTGDYPDVIGGWLVYGAEIVKYGSGEGIFIPLEDLFAKYAPNVMECLEIPGIRTNMTLPDGHIYSPPYPVPEPEMIFSPWINKVWLDNLGLEMPTTIDEFYNVLVAFKEKDANRNGDSDDEIPLGAQPSRLGFWFALFGLQVNGAEVVLVDDTVIFPAIEESYKDAIKFFRKLYTEQLLDTEVFTADHDSFFANGRGKDAIYGSAILYNPNDISPGLGEDGLNIRSYDYVPLPPLDNGTGVKPLWTRGSTGITTFISQFVITDAAKNPATIARWLDYVYSEDISRQLWFGKYDVTLKDNGDGTFSPMEKTEITGAPGYTQTLSSLPKWARSADFTNVKKDAAGIQADAYNTTMDALWANNMTTKIPTLWSTAEESKEISTIEVDLTNHIILKRADWITGAADIDEDWDEYIEDLNSMGLKKLMEIKTAQIKKALEN